MPRWGRKNKNILASIVAMLEKEVSWKLSKMPYMGWAKHHGKYYPAVVLDKNEWNFSETDGGKVWVVCLGFTKKYLCTDKNDNGAMSIVTQSPIVIQSSIKILSDIDKFI
uniref:Uncharacterized protein n=1 Tax=Romanomermis culicivorax TaxID=13658 RepID=A0A915L0F7_ROMCU